MNCNPDPTPTPAHTHNNTQTNRAGTPSKTTMGDGTAPVWRRLLLAPVLLLALALTLAPPAATTGRASAALGPAAATAARAPFWGRSGTAARGDGKSRAALWGVRGGGDKTPHLDDDEAEQGSNPAAAGAAAATGGYVGLIDCHCPFPPNRSRWG